MAAIHPIVTTRDWFGPARGRHSWAFDALVALTIAVAQVGGTAAYGEHEPSPWTFDAGAVLLLLPGPVALLFRRRWPDATLAVAFVAAAGYAASGYQRGPAGFPAFVFALVNVIMIGRRAWAWAVLAVAVGAFTVLPHVNPDAMEAARSYTGTATNLLWLPLVAAAAEIARIREDRRAEREHAAQEETRRRAGEERLRIARELHDVLAHNISLINVRSGVALHLLARRPEEARPALEAINEASEEALGELRAALDVLHGGGGAPRFPVAGLGGVEDLVARSRAAGLDVRLETGDLGAVPGAVSLAAFRVVQEALTNVARHADDTAPVVRLRRNPHDLVLEVLDEGSAPPGAGDPGYGIAGMRERVAALGGRLEAGPRPGRGFAVRAWLPLTPEQGGAA